MTSASLPQILLKAMEALGSKVHGVGHEIGGSLLMLKETFRLAFKKPYRLRSIFQQMEFIGNQSLMIIVICAFFIGSALSLQVGTIFVIFGAESMLGAANGKALARELSPLIAGFLLAGRVGASITAEIATMKVNEQIDAMEAMAVDPISYLVVPRVVAGILMLPVLVGIFNVIGQLASLLIATTIFGIAQGTFFSRMVQVMEINDIMQGMQKAVVFGAIITLLACQFGLSASGGAKGVGRATTNSVVTVLLVLLLVDFIITYIQVAL
ncbi:MAG: MlaE family ABC transporter permease [Oligoflexus sp.]